MSIIKPYASTKNDVAKLNNTEKCSCSSVKRNMWTTKENEQKDLIIIF